LSPLLASAHVLELVGIFDRGLDGNGFTSKRLARVRVDVVPGEPTPCTIDLAFAHRTAPVVVSVTLAGKPPQDDLSVALLPRDPFDAAGHELPSHYGRLVNGRCLFDRVAAGTYDVRVIQERLWSHACAEPLVHTDEHVARGAGPTFAADIPLIRRELCVVTGDGAPWSNTNLWIGPADMRGTGVILMTTADGKLVLELPAHRYAVHAGSNGTYRGVAPVTVELDWRPGEGPLSITLPAP
jgi:hypothetical protein